MPFIQLGATPPGPANEGHGQFITVEKLEELERIRIRERMNELKPELFAEAVRATRAKQDADAAAEKVRREIHLVVGGDGVRAALLMVEEEIKKQNIAAEVAKKQQSQPAKK